MPPAATEPNRRDDARLAWNQTTADRLIAEVIARHRRTGWAQARKEYRRRGELMDAIDGAFLTRDFAELRKAVSAFLYAIPAPSAEPAWPPFLDGPVSSCPGCAACRPAGITRR